MAVPHFQGDEDYCNLDDKVESLHIQGDETGQWTDLIVSRLAGVRASNSVGAPTRMWNSNLAKFTCNQIVRVLMCTADLDFRFG
jgi:hypothetical protein